MQEKRAGVIWTILKDLVTNSPKFTLMAVFVVSIAVVHLLMVYPLRALMGISEIEGHLSELSSYLGKSEDTILSLRYDFDVPDVRPEVVEHIGTIGFDKFIQSADVPPDYYDNSGGVHGITDEEIREAHELATIPIKRTFLFSAAHETESTLHYDIRCFVGPGRTMTTTKPFRFNIAINGKSIGVHPPGASGRTVHLDGLLGRADSITTASNHSVRKHTLLIEALGAPSRAMYDERSFATILDGIRECTFNALIIVRDQAPVYARAGFATGVKKWFWESE